MRYQTDRSKHDTFIIMVCLLGVFVSASSLLGLRLYASSLESRVANAVSRIEKCKGENEQMERKCAMLLSPSSVYKYAQENLNMSVAEESPVIYVDAGAASMAKAGNGAMRSAEISAFERYNPFVNKAHAKN